VAFALPDQGSQGTSSPVAVLANKQPDLKGHGPPDATISSAVAASRQVTDDLPAGEGRGTVLATCTKCHGPSNFTTLHMSRTAWEAEVEDMKDKGATGTADDFKTIVDYLARNFPPR
jgi:hypothetical protein